MWKRGVSDTFANKASQIVTSKRVTLRSSNGRSEINSKQQTNPQQEDINMNNSKFIFALTIAAFASGCATQGGNYDRGYSNDGGQRPYYSGQSQSGPAQSSGGGNAVMGQVAGAAAGGLLGAQVGRGNGRVAASAVGAAGGAYAGGRIADPCAPTFNMGHIVGAIFGGLAGAQIGKGNNSHTAGSAVGAAVGSTVGGNVMGTSPCR